MKLIIYSFLLILFFSCKGNKPVDLNFITLNCVGDKIELYVSSKTNLNTMFYVNNKGTFNSYIFCPLESNNLTISNIENENYVILGHDSSRCLRPISTDDSIYFYKFSLDFLEKDRNTEIPYETLKTILKDRKNIKGELVIINGYYNSTISKTINLPVDEIFKKYGQKKGSR